MSEIETQIYETKDLYLAAYLISIGYTRYSLEKFERQFLFSFYENKNQEQIEIDVAKYWDESIKVSPKQLFNGLKELKYRMYPGGKLE